MGRLGNKALKWALIVLFAAIFIGGVAQAVSVDVFNKTAHTATGADESQQTYLRFSDRDDSTSSWLKRGFDLNGEKVDLKAQTIDGTLVNASDDTVASWELTINVEGDCFINNAWVGTVEIHQFVGTDKEATQTLDLRDYDLADVELAYRYDGDLLIPLAKGDYLVYHPDVKDEFEIAPQSELTMGMIFYYLDDLDLSNYAVEYYYHRDITHGVGFIVLAALAIIWVLILAGWGVADVSYKRAKRELDLRKSSLSTMSSVYSIITFIDLQNDELIPVYANEKTKEALPQGADARKKLMDIFARDTTGSHRTVVLEFIDIETLPARLESNTIALEYVSESFGWSEVRFFAVDRKEGKPLERVLLTIRDINDEKRELERFETQTARVELESTTRNAIINGASTNMRVPLGAIEELAGKIMDEAGDDAVRDYARQIKVNGASLSFLIDGVVDFSQSSTDDIEIACEEYSLASVIADVRDIAGGDTADGGYVLETEISPSIPDRLIGDARRIKQVLVGILVYVSHRTGAKVVKLSAYGSAHGTDEHLLISVKADGPAMPESEARALADFVSSVERYGAYAVDDVVQELEGIALLLAFMGSDLQVVNEPGQGIELYFEIEQPIAGS